MKSVCVDGYNLALAQGSGIATYGRNLLTNLREMGFSTQVLYGPTSPRQNSDLLNEIALTDAKAPRRTKPGLARSVSTLTSRFGRKVYPIQPSKEVIWPGDGAQKPSADRLWASRDLFNLSKRAFQTYRTFTPVTFDPETSNGTPPDIVHWTCPLPLKAPDRLNVYTFHDLIPLRLPHTTLDDKRTYLALCHRILKEADHILAVSETTKNDVVRLLGADPEKITTTYQSVDVSAELSRQTDEEAASQIEGVFNLGWKEYFLFFGAMEPKKNLGRIVEAYLSSRTKTPLIVVTGRSWLQGDETSLLSQTLRDPANGIRQIDYLPAHLLASLVRGAKATLFPSLYEGFGLPVLESMSLKTAVLGSTAGALPEISGDAALLVDPLDVEALKKGILALDNDDDMRHEFERRGSLQSAKFSPAAYRARLQAVYKVIVTP